MQHKDQQIQVLSAECTHGQCTVKPHLDGMLHCPCHAAVFNETGGVVKGPATVPLLPVESKLARGHIIINWTK